MPRTKPAPEPVRLSRQLVCHEALTLVDEEGLEALSMRRLGARLGVEAMSLYRYVRNKADLLDALHAAVLGDLAPPALRESDADWRGVLGGLARALRAALLRHPHVAPLFTRLPLRAPEAVATMERAQAALRTAGLAPRAVEEVIHVVGIFTIGHVLFETNEQGRGERPSTFRFGLEAVLDAIERRIADARG
jgi:TetR/AcrR family transcriptional regulator, tetracycline repressor protein